MREDARYLAWLINVNGYRNVRVYPDGRWAATQQFMFTNAIIVGRMGDMVGYEDRWCYHDEPAALAALEAWNGEGEPVGWHRHPGTGRRTRQDGSEEVFY